MDFLHRIQQHLELKRREADTAHELAQLSDRALGDLGLLRADIRRVAREAARAGLLDLAEYRARHDSAGAPAALVGLGLGLRAV
jgi:uncharacterized protein YjiS (DUF1127 family)